MAVKLNITSYPCPTYYPVPPRWGMNFLRLANQVSDGETITFQQQDQGGFPFSAAEVYEIDTNSSVTPGNIRVDCTIPSGTIPSGAAYAIALAVNNNSTLVSGQVVQTANGNYGVLFVSPFYDFGIHTESVVGATIGQGTLTVAESLASSNNTFHATAAFYGPNPSVDRKMDMVSRSVISKETTVGQMEFYFPFNIASVIVQIRTAAGVLKTWDGAISIDNGRLILDNSGSSDFVATDIVTVFAST